MSEKGIIIGANGMLGHTLVEYFGRRGAEIKAVTRRDYNIGVDPFIKMEGLLAGAGWVINCAAMLSSRAKELPPEDVFAVNTLFPRMLAAYCASREIPFIQISTDGVFTGSSGKYVEHDPPDNKELYAMSKIGGEPPECIVIRVSLIGEERSNARSFLEKARQHRGKEIHGYINHYWNGITTFHFCEILDRLVLDKRTKPGVYHLFSPEDVSKDQLLNLISETYNLNLKVIEKSAPQGVNRTLRSVKELAKRYCTKPLKQQFEEMKVFLG